MSGAVPPKRKRDRVWNAVHRFRASSPSPSQPVSAQSVDAHNSTSPGPSSSAQQSRPTTGPPRNHFLVSALQRLNSKDKATVEKQLPSGRDDIVPAVDGVYNAAKDKQQLCEANKWTWTIQGRTVKLRDATDKILYWLDRFKDVGDGIASLDPIHAGLPWAGIRLLLEATVSASREMAALISGLDVALYMMNRLKVYCEHFARLPKTLAMSNFEEELTAFYAHILQFLAVAIRKFQKGTVGRSFEALFKAGDVGHFEDECDRLGQRTEKEAQNCDRELAADLSNAVSDLKDVYIQIKTSIGVLQDKFDLSKLPVAEGATFDSYDEQFEAMCLEHTRVDLLNEIDKWANDLNGKAIFWLQGMAGTGKSTISRTVARKFGDRDQLCASFFFKRGRGDRGGSRRFFTSIAAQLARHDPMMQRHIADLLDGKPELAEDKSLQVQFEKLVLEPLSRYSAGASQASSQTISMVIVIDALDECDPERDTRRILQLLGQLKDIVCLRLFVTSRPELPIRMGFTEMEAKTHYDVDLHDIERVTIEHDIRLYFEYRFANIRTERLKRQPQYPLPLDWPGKDNISRLVKTAVPLFIFAATACNFIEEPRADPVRRLAAVLSSPQRVSPSKFDYTYQPILNQMLIEGDEQDEQQLLDDFKELVGPIVVYFEPLSANSTASLLGISIPHIDRTLDWLHSVLKVPEDPNMHIRLFHLSFRDFLLDPKKRDKSPFWIDEQTVHQLLSDRCLKLLSESRVLKRDLLNLERPGVRRDEIDKQVVEDTLPPEVSYACRYWVYHLQNGNGLICDGSSVHDFLLTHFLHWMEALSWLGKLSGIVAQVSILRSLVSNENSKEVASFLDDAKRFVHKNRQLVDTTPHQLYSSALIFAPEKSVVRRTYLFDRPAWLSTLPKPSVNWDAELQELEGHNGYIYSITCSSDGRLIASGSSDKTARLWDSTTGEEVMRLSDHGSAVSSVSLSHDNRILAAASGPTVTLWDLSSGTAMWQLEEESKYVDVKSVAFSPNSELLALACLDHTVSLWDVPSQKELWKLSCHNAEVNVVAFSSDGRLIASGSRDRKVVLMDCSRGNELRVLSGHEDEVNDVAFSKRDKLLASASNDHTVILWDISTGSELRRLTDHSDGVSAVDFSHDGKLLASRSWDETLRLWDPATGSEIYKLGNQGGIRGNVRFVPHYSLLALAFGQLIRIWDFSSFPEQREVNDIYSGITRSEISSDNRFLATVSNDRTVTLWDPSSGAEVQKLEGHKDKISAVIFSPDCRLLASASYQGPVIMWDLATGEELWKTEGDFVSQKFTFSSDSRLLALPSFNNTVRLLACSTGEEISSLSYPDGIRALDFSSDSKMFAVGCRDGYVRMQAPLTGKELWKRDDAFLLDHGAFSPDSALFAVLDSYGNLSLWDSLTGDEVRELSCDSRFVTAVAFSSDGNLLAAAFTDRIVRLWDCLSGDILHTSPWENEIRSMCFSPDNMHLMTNIGCLDVKADKHGQVIELSIGDGLFLNGEWIMYNGEHSLWLPSKYRPGDLASVLPRKDRRTHSALAGSVLIIGQPSGGVWFLGL